MEFATHRCSSAGLATLIELDRTLRTISILTLTHGCCSGGGSGAMAHANALTNTHMLKGGARAATLRL